MKFKSPYPFFGGKSAIAPVAWRAFGNDIKNYVEPFFGSGAVMLANPFWTPDCGLIETINDKDGFISNFWRSVQKAPDEVAYWADWPVIENDLHARHKWLVERKEALFEKLENDPDYYDAKIAGWWVWGISIWIGQRWCTTKRSRNRNRVHLGNQGMGVHRRRVHLGNIKSQGHQITIFEDCRKDDGSGTGINGLYAWMQALSLRLRRVRICSGDWSRVCGPTPTIKNGLTALFFDPPYSDKADRDKNLYSEENLHVAHDVRSYCLEHGNNPMLRIALCGYRGEHDELGDAGWRPFFWKAHGGYSLQNKNNERNPNRYKEVIWFSPHCLI